MFLFSQHGIFRCFAVVGDVVSADFPVYRGGRVSLVGGGRSILHVCG